MKKKIQQAKQATLCAHFQTLTAIKHNTTRGGAIITNQEQENYPEQTAVRNIYLSKILDLACKHFSV